ncbi:hypothetical protein GGR50DRAFT_689297 [Xylaria sp. CBS 124048]|nr:hypothetical protein GGR50DRAFT_689297 [Xylaria sp. CBS 124048]
MITSQTLSSVPRCALDLVAPDWNVCQRENAELESSLRMTRIVTYTRGKGQQVGTLSCDFDHSDESHILTPWVDFDRNAAVVNVGFSSDYMQQFYRSHTHVCTLGTSDLAIESAGEVLADNWRNLMPLRNQRMRDILPFDDEPVDAVKMKAVPLSTPIYRYLRHIVVHSPLELTKLSAENQQQQAEAFDNALDLDRSAHLWLSWSQMPRLESVFLDLRIYSHELNTKRRCLSKSQIMARAQEMGRHLQLKTLMLVGLQSYIFETDYTDVTANDIEERNEIDGEPNWIKIFRPAVREGGKIILVDKVVDHPSWMNEMATTRKEG